MLGVVGAAAAFGGGLKVKKAIDDIPKPHLQRRTPGTGKGLEHSFKLSVRVVGASVPALGKPGMLSRQRPKLEATLGKVQKETELADWDDTNANSDAERAGAGACARECPWRFGDTLTFIVKLKDLLGPGLRLQLRAHSDITLGALQFNFSQVDELGEACVDLRRRAVPGCVRDTSRRASAEIWQGPVLPIPLSHVRGGIAVNNQELGQAVGHLAIAFSIDMDPEEILATIDAETRTVSEAIAAHTDNVIANANSVMANAENIFGHANNMMKWLGSPAGSPVQKSTSSHLSASRGDPNRQQRRHSSGNMNANDMAKMAKRALARRGSVPNISRPLPSPDEVPEGWISREAPNGRVYWHNRELGPAPWETCTEDNFGVKMDTPAESLQRSSATAQSNPCASFGPIKCPNLPTEEWVSHRNREGRTFWHNRALGPAPWERYQH